MKLAKQYKRFFLDSYANTENAHLDDAQHKLIKKTLATDFDYNRVKKLNYLGSVPEQDCMLFVLSDGQTPMCFMYKKHKPKSFGQVKHYIDKHVGLTKF